MPEYQIQINYRKGCAVYEYFKASKNKAGEVACKRAIQAVNQLKERHYTRIYVTTRFRIPRIIHVREWDSVNKRVKKNGHQFKLESYFIEATYIDGSKKRKDWYEVQEN